MWRDCGNDERVVMVWALMRATHQEVRRVFDGAVILLRPGQFITSYASIAEECQLRGTTSRFSYKKARNAVTKLEKWGFWAHNGARKGRHSGIVITLANWDETLGTVPFGDRQPGTQEGTSWARKGHVKGTQRATNKHSSSTGEQESQDTHTLAGGEQEGFERFWSTYPRKVGREAAWKAWREIGPNAKLAGEIVSAVAKQIKDYGTKWSEENGRFCPYPGKWLRERRWADAPSVAAPEPDYSEL